MGHGLPFLQYRAAALRPSDGDVSGSLIATALFSLVPLLWQKAEKGREGRRAEADRRRAADRRPAQGVHHVRPFDDFAHRRFDHRYHRAAAGAAAHLGGVIAAYTTVPVIGIPINATPLNGMDALLSFVQMPAGIPVATMAINGAKNAALFAVQILSVKYPELVTKLAENRLQMQEEVKAKR